MIKMNLRRSKDDRRRFHIDDDAWWRSRSLVSRSADATVDGCEYVLRRSGFLGQQATVEDAHTGEVVATWHRRGGRIVAGGEELSLSRHGRWGRSWTLCRGSSELARFVPRGWRSDLHIELDTGAALSRVVLLFATWTAAGLVSDDDSSAAGGAAAATG
jgi:hypothetical protein